MSVQHSIFTGTAGTDENTLTGRGFARTVDGHDYGSPLRVVRSVGRFDPEPQVEPVKAFVWVGIFLACTLTLALTAIALRPALALVLHLFGIEA